MRNRPININHTYDKEGIGLLYRDIPNICTRAIRKPIIDLSVQLPRNPKKRKKYETNQADYKPNYFFGKSHPTSLHGPLHKTISKRKPKYYKSIAENT